MGGAGGSFFPDEDPKTLRERIREAEDRARTQEFDLKVSSELEKLLRSYNDRDVTGIERALADVKQCLQAQIERTVDLVFGGSVAKHTYVDGVSDVDALVILQDPSLQAKSPQEVLSFFEAQLRSQLQGWRVRAHGQLAVTVQRGNIILQLVPAVRMGEGVRIPAPEGDRWSKIRPRRFARRLSDMNGRLGLKLVPTIKLVKAVNDTFPNAYKLSGYHIEALATEAFHGYKGARNPKAMLEHFFERASQLVLSPLRDTTEQSLHVDEYLRTRNSEARRARSTQLERTLRQMKNANGAESLPQWLRIFGEE